MDKSDLALFLVCAVWILDVIGWWVALFLWTIPTCSILVSAVATLTLWSIIAVILFFAVWMPLMAFGVIIFLGVVFG